MHSLPLPVFGRHVHTASQYDKKCLKFVQGLDFSKGLAREIEGKERKTKEKRGEMREVQGLNFL